MTRRARRGPDSGIAIATRASELALRQARLVQEALGARGLTSELITFKTTGDKRTDEPLSGIGAKGLFTRELELALANGKVDCCVHSLKDLPTESPDGLGVAALLKREDPRDVLIVHDSIAAERLADLPSGSRVGTSSLRRRAQVMHARGDLEVVELRGSVPTRLRKVDKGQVHAAILAAAGLLRLGVRQRIDGWLDPPEWLPAPGQGAIAIQARTDDARMWTLISSLDDAPTSVACRAERAFLASLEGGCQIPIAALAMESQTGLLLCGLISDVRGERTVRGEQPVDVSNPEDSGARLADELRRRGGEEILSSLRMLTSVPVPQPK